jgi:hypothetical protein
MESKHGWKIVQQTMVGATPCQDSLGKLQTLDENGARDYDGTYSTRYLIETSKTICKERSVGYITNVTYSKGVPSVHYTMRDIEPQPVEKLFIKIVWEASINDIFPGDEQPGSRSIDAAFAASPYLQRLRDYLKEKFRYWNAFTIYTAFMDTIESETYGRCFPPSTSVKCDRKFKRSNGSRVVFGLVECQQLENGKCIGVRLSRTAKPIT